MNEKRNILSSRRLQISAALLSTILTVGCSTGKDSEPKQPAPESTASTQAAPDMEPMLQEGDINTLDLRVEVDGEDIDEKSITFSMQDGKLVSDFSGDTSSDDYSYLQSAVLENQQYILPAVQAGYLEQIQFTFGARSQNLLLPDGYIAYSAKDQYVTESAVNYVLPARHDLSNVLVASMLRHETFHALFQGTDIADKRDSTEVGYGEKGYVDRAEFDQLCGQLRTWSIDERVALAPSINEQLAAILDDPKLADIAPIAEQIDTAMRNGTYETLLPQNGQELEPWPSELPTCLQESPARTLVRMMTPEQREKYGSQRDYSDNSLSSRFATIDRAWDAASEQTNDKGELVASLTTVLREAMYLQEIGESHGNGAGHWFNNANELGTSLLNIVITWPDSFDDKLAELPKNQKVVVKRTIVAAANILAEKYSNADGLSEEMQSIAERYS